MINKRFLLAFILFLSFLFLGCDSSKKEDEFSKKERIAHVKVFKVKKGAIASYIYATGTLKPNQEARLGPKVDGRIEKIYVDEGDFVEKGKPLIKLEQETYIIEENRAEAALNTAMAYLKKIEVNLKNIAKDWKRFSSLYKEKAISEQRYDKIDTEYTEAQAELNFARAKVKEAEANLAMKKENLKDSITYAPFSGFIVKKLMEKGEVSNWVTYQWDVLHLQDISKVKIECPIAETKICFFKIGKELNVEVDAFKDEKFKGKITTINPMVDPKSRTFNIKIGIANSKFKLKGGMFARVKIVEREKKGVLIIPKKAILVKGDEHIVFRVENSLAKGRKVKLGISDGENVEILEGLGEGDHIVVYGLYALKDGVKVEIIE
jgi:RND family efflux transporter MFP subunit